MQGCGGQINPYTITDSLGITLKTISILSFGTYFFKLCHWHNDFLKSGLILTSKIIISVLINKAVLEYPTSTKGWVVKLETGIRSNEKYYLLVWHDVHVKIFQEQFNLDTKGSVEERTGIIVEISLSVTQKRKSAYQGGKIKVFVAQRKFFIQAGQESGASFLSTSPTALLSSFLPSPTLRQPSRGAKVYSVYCPLMFQASLNNELRVSEYITSWGWGLKGVHPISPTFSSMPTRVFSTNAQSRSASVLRLLTVSWDFRT